MDPDGCAVGGPVTPSMLVMHGWDVTLQKVAGTDLAFDLSIRKVS